MHQFPLSQGSNKNGALLSVHLFISCGLYGADVFLVNFIEQLANTRHCQDINYLILMLLVNKTHFLNLNLTFFLNHYK